MSRGGSPNGRPVDGARLRLAIVASRWHAEITDALVDRATAAARACGIDSPRIVRVAGAAELPVVAAALAQRSDAVACLGAVIRGETPHFEYICTAVAYGLTMVALDSGTPVGNGVLTCETLEQAKDRCGHSGSAEDKGWEAVIAVLDAALVMRRSRRAW